MIAAKQQAQFVRSALVGAPTGVGSTDPPERSGGSPGAGSAATTRLEQLLAAEAEESELRFVHSLVDNRNVGVVEPSHQQRDALILLLEERPDLFDPEDRDGTLRRIAHALLSASRRAEDAVGSRALLTRPELARSARLVGRRTEVQQWLMMALTARSLRDPGLGPGPLFAEAWRSMLVRASVRAQCIERGVAAQDKGFAGTELVHQNAWWAASEAVMNEFHRIEASQESSSATPWPDGHQQAGSNLMRGAALRLHPVDRKELDLLEAVCRYAHVVRHNAKATAIRAEARRSALFRREAAKLENGSASGRVQVSAEDPQDVESAALAAGEVEALLDTLAGSGDPLSSDAAAAVRLVHAVVRGALGETGESAGAPGFEATLAWFEQNYPPLAGPYGGRSSLHWSIAQAIRPHNVRWPSVTGPGPRPRKFVSRLKARFDEAGEAGR